MQKSNDFKGVHHVYLGFLLAVIGFFLIWVYLPIAIPIFLFGQWLIFDDFYQHARKQKDPEYQSPAHRLFGLIYKWKWVRKITAFFDNLLGR